MTAPQPRPSQVTHQPVGQVGGVVKGCNKEGKPGRHCSHNDGLVQYSTKWLSVHDRHEAAADDGDREEH